MVNESARVYVIGHPGGRELAFSFQDNELLDHEGPPAGQPQIEGVCRVRFAGSDSWLAYSGGQSFNVPGKSSFDIEVTPAARQFLGQLTFTPDAYGRSDQAAIVWFNDTAAIEQPLTRDRTSLDRALDRIHAVEGSRIDLGLKAGHEAVLVAAAIFPLGMGAIGANAQARSTVADHFLWRSPASASRAE